MSFLLKGLFLYGIFVLAHASAPSGPWDAFNYGPESRTVRPNAIFQTGGAVSDASNLLSETSKATLSGNGSYVSLDFGREVSGSRMECLELRLSTEYEYRSED